MLEIDGDGKPIMVVRNYKGQKQGNWYDGIYKVVKYWPEKGQSGFIVWKYLFWRDDPAPGPWTAEGRMKEDEHEDDSFILMFNAHHEAIDFTLPPEHFGMKWKLLVDTTEAGLVTDRWCFHPSQCCFWFWSALLSTMLSSSSYIGNISLAGKIIPPTY